MLFVFQATAFKQSKSFEDNPRSEVSFFTLRENPQASCMVNVNALTFGYNSNCMINALTFGFNPNYMLHALTFGTTLAA